jgi:hypothetical protein
VIGVNDAEKLELRDAEYKLRRSVFARIRENTGAGVGGKDTRMVETQRSACGDGTPGGRVETCTKRCT